MYITSMENKNKIRYSREVMNQAKESKISQTKF